MSRNLCFIKTVTKTKKTESTQKNTLGFVSKMRLELTQPTGHYPLKVARLPIPPPGQMIERFERKTGLEPATPTLARSCSTN